MRDTLSQVHSSAGARNRVVELHVVYGPARPLPAAVALAGEAVVIGRDGPGLVTADDEVSRRHARVDSDGAGGWRIVDLGSRNGTYLDGERLDAAAPLRPGGVIRIGRTLVVLVDLELPARAVLRRETETIRGHGPAMQLLRGAIATTARQTTPLLVLGETGAGKECVAREVHERSGRTGAFVPVNCAALPDNLAESELYGHAAGAFTGAAGSTRGLFSAAEGGTLFLDEIGELPLATQPKLLRALALGEVRAVGTSAPRRVDVRVVAATHVDLARAVADGRFRADLYARLSGVVLHVPPLRSHPEDILRLARLTLEQLGRGLALSAGAAEALLLYDWPYNVRELEQTLAAAAAQAGADGLIASDHLPPIIAEPVQGRGPPGSAPPESAPSQPPSPEQLAALLLRHQGNVVRVAESLGKDRRQVYRWMRRFGLAADRFRER